METTVKKAKLRKGLSLVEIVAVVAIIAIISLAAIARFNDITEASRVSTLDSTFNTFVAAITMYEAVSGDRPGGWAALDDFIQGTADASMFVNIGSTANPVVVNLDFSGGHVVGTITMANLNGDHSNRQGDFNTTTGMYTLSIDTR